MREIFPRAFLSRRAFLRRAAASSAAALAAPHLPEFVISPFQIPLPRRIGVLLPPFRSFPQVGESFLDGMALFLAEQDALAALRLFASDARTYSGISSQEMAALCEAEAVDVVVSMANPTAVDDVQALLLERSIPLLVSHAGANRAEGTTPNVFYNSLGYWQASYRAGTWAAKSLGSRAVVVSSFYESGYDALYSFEEGFSAGGGRVTGRFVTHMPGHSPTMGELVRAIGAAGTDFVYGHLSAEAAAEFLTAYRGSSRTRHIPLLGAMFMLPDAVPGDAGGAVRSAFRDVHSVGTWSLGLQTVANEAFCHAFEACYGRAADSFAVLGYETAGLLAAAAQEAEAQNGSLNEALKHVVFEGPRGRLEMDARTQCVTPPLCLRQLAWQGSAFETSVLAALEPVSEALERTAGVRSGWIHPYLSI